MVSWLKSTVHKDRKGVLQRLTWLDPHLSPYQLRQIDTDRLYRVREAKLAEGVAPSTANRHMAAVSAVLRHAHKRGWIKAVPAIPKSKERGGRIRFLSHQEARDLLDYLRARPRSPHLVDIVEFALATGLREANITGLEWSRVDLGNRLAWIPLDEAKGGRNLRVPLNDLAIAVLERRQGIHDRWVFTYRGKRLAHANRDGYRGAVAAMGWDDVNFHTLRHTWASWHVMAGTPLQVLKELGGWRSMDMVLRYAHLAPDHLDQFAGNATANWLENKVESGSAGARTPAFP